MGLGGGGGEGGSLDLGVQKACLTWPLCEQSSVLRCKQHSLLLYFVALTCVLLHLLLLESWRTTRFCIVAVIL